MALPLYSLLLWHGNGHSQISEHLEDRAILGKGTELQKSLHVFETIHLSLLLCHPAPLGYPSDPMTL